MKLRKSLMGVIMAGLLSVPALADMDINGQIVSVNDAKKNNYNSRT